MLAWYKLTIIESTLLSMIMAARPSLILKLYNNFISKTYRQQHNVEPFLLLLHGHAGFLHKSVTCAWLHHRSPSRKKEMQKGIFMASQHYSSALLSDLRPQSIKISELLIAPWSRRVEKVSQLPSKLFYVIQIENKSIQLISKKVFDVRF